MHRIFAALSLVALAGCAGLGPPVVFAKAGATQQDYRAANYACERDVAMMRLPDTFGGAAAANDYYIDCMHAHGWFER